MFVKESVGVGLTPVSCIHYQHDAHLGCNLFDGLLFVV